MRISLSPEASQVFESIVSRIEVVNPFIERDNTRFLSAVVVAYERSAGAREIDELVQAVSTPESRRRALIRQIEQVSLGMDAQAIRNLEASVRKLGSQPKKSEVTENERIKSES